MNEQSRAQDIRDAATSLFYERGYHGTSMREIATRVNMRAPSLYNHLDSKQQLLQEIMRNDVALITREVVDAMATSDDVITKFRRGFEAHVRHHTRFVRESRICMTELSALEEPAQTAIKELRREYAVIWRGLIEQAVHEGRATTSNAHLAANAIIDLGIGIARWYRADGPLTEATLAGTYSDFALNLIGATEG